MLAFSIKFMIPLLAPILMRINPNGPLRTLWKSAADVIRACFEIDAPKGKALYLNGSEEHGTSREATDTANRKALWDYSIPAASIRQGDTVLANWR